MQEPRERPSSAGSAFLNHTSPPGKSPWLERVVSTLISAAQTFVPGGHGSQGPQSTLMLGRDSTVLTAHGGRSSPRIWRAWQALLSS